MPRKLTELEQVAFPRWILGALGEIIGTEENPFFVTTSPMIRTDNTPKVFEDTSFVTGDSPATLDANNALARNATEFSVQNDGPGDFTVSVSIDGELFGQEKTVKSGEVYAIDNISVNSLRITWITNSAYRVTVL